MASAAAWHWLRSPEDAWVPGRLLSATAAGRAFDVGGETRIYPESDIGPRIDNPAGLSEDYDDMVKMEDVNEATILHNLRLRFATARIYTGIGDVLVSVNPFQTLPIYGPDEVERYYSLRAGEEAPPHLYMVANNAYKGLTELRHDQSIIISGESGAGKTEATKKCLAFLADVAGASPASAGLDRRLLAANPILEAFGNAKTVRNNNSSRFGAWARAACPGLRFSPPLNVHLPLPSPSLTARAGKWMAVHFNGRAQISGCHIDTYLLEKSRVTAQARGPLYRQRLPLLPPALALPSPPPPSPRRRPTSGPTTSSTRCAPRLTTRRGRSCVSRVQLPTTGTWALQAASRVRRGGGARAAASAARARTPPCPPLPSVRGVSDAHEFADVLTSCLEMGLAREEVAALLRVAAAVLHLGDLSFAGAIGDEGRVGGWLCCCPPRVSLQQRPLRRRPLAPPAAATATRAASSTRARPRSTWRPVCSAWRLRSSH